MPARNHTTLAPVGACYVRNMLQPGQMPQVLGGIFASALTLRALDSALPTCLFFEKDQDAVVGAWTQISGLPVGAIPINTVLPILSKADILRGEGIPRRALPLLRHVLPVMADGAREWKVLSRLSRFDAYARAPYKRTLFLDGDTALCTPQAPVPGGPWPGGGTTGRWDVGASISALFAQRDSPDVRLLFKDTLDRDQDLEDECAHHACATECGYSAPRCVACVLGCMDRPPANSTVHGVLERRRPFDRGACSLLRTRSQPLGAVVAIRRGRGATAFLRAWRDAMLKVNVYHTSLLVRAYASRLNAASDAAGAANEAEAAAEGADESEEGPRGRRLREDGAEGGPKGERGAGVGRPLRRLPGRASGEPLSAGDAPASWSDSTRRERVAQGGFPAPDEVRAVKKALFETCFRTGSPHPHSAFTDPASRASGRACLGSDEVALSLLLDRECSSAVGEGPASRGWLLGGMRAARIDFLRHGSYSKHGTPSRCERHNTFAGFLGLTGSMRQSSPFVMHDLGIGLERDRASNRPRLEVGGTSWTRRATCAGPPAKDGEAPALGDIFIEEGGWHQRMCSCLMCQGAPASVATRAHG